MARARGSICLIKTKERLCTCNYILLSIQFCVCVILKNCFYSSFIFPVSESTVLNMMALNMHTILINYRNFNVYVSIKYEESNGYNIGES